MSGNYVNYATANNTDALDTVLERLRLNTLGNQMVDNAAVLETGLSVGTVVKYDSTDNQWEACDGTVELVATDVIGIVTYIDGTDDTEGQVKIGGVYVKSGLTADTDYYCQSNGSINTTETKVYLGHCCAAGQLVLKINGGAGDWPGDDPAGATIYGVMATSQSANDGVGLQHIDRYGRVITLTTTDFDAHAAFGGDTAFDEYTDGDSNVFCKIPIAYWWRGNINGKWCMLISDQPGTYAGKTFTASPGAFLQDGEWMEQFYIGKYRGHDAGDSKIGSIAGQTHLGSVSFNDWRTRCANVGTGYHLLSLFEWHEILARMVVEKATFQLIPEASRTTAGSCVYRGITDFAYSGTVYAEWMDGVRTDASGKWELWDEADGTYISSGVACPEYSGPNYYPPSLSASFPYLFLGGGACVAIASAWVPDLNGRPSGYVSRICYSNFNAGDANYGALDTHFHREATETHAAIGGRLAKW